MLPDGSGRNPRGRPPPEWRPALGTTSSRQARLSQKPVGARCSSVSRASFSRQPRGTRRSSQAGRCGSRRALLAPVVLCGGLTMVASETFFLSSQSSSRIPQHWPRVWRALSSESEGGRSDARCQSKVADPPDAGECRRTRILAAAHGATCVTSPPAVLRPRRDLLRSRLRRRRARRQGVLRPRRLT